MKKIRQEKRPHVLLETPQPTQELNFANLSLFILILLSIGMIADLTYLWLKEQPMKFSSIILDWIGIIVAAGMYIWAKTAKLVLKKSPRNQSPSSSRSP